VIRVFVVDDHPVVRTGVRFILEASGEVEVVGEAGSAEEALAKVEAARPDLVLIDITLPGMSGVELARALKGKTPARLLALSMHEEPEYVEAFLEAGGSGYVTKSGLEKELLDAVRALARGEHYLPHRLLYDLIRQEARPEEAGPEVLTPRELEVVLAIAQGLTYREIAEKLGIAEKTVATYRERASEKLGLKSRVELARWAAKRELL
jgi:two-component system response regulator NreC